MRRKQSWPVAASLGVLLLFLVPMAPSALAQRSPRKYKAPPATAHIVVSVVKASTGKPIHNAAVIFHPMKKDKDLGNMELKTNEQGKATLDVVPIGTTVLLQVIAEGYRTYGKEYQIDGDSKTILVKMELPKNQYSTYKEGGNGDNLHTNAPQSQMGQAAPADSPLLTPPPKPKN